ncbi:MAG: EAL domain-containing protein [Leptolyngbyaceae cyanobacterium SL_1_1]|nr:EAL domain-containing protein [Leptolyngbyaceae cyanobacterium RM2_2_21]NJN02585.1 EAL domain-containing protein [Leptolyngbyaceae cyanobacterium RM1_1_2]NJO08598.1 EAL domain-containing protein [Leptolyngbyaceae cyanobacterium SL_1_1]
MQSPSVTSSILIVDDNPDNLRLLSEVLTHEGYEVRKATSGSMAIKSVQTLLPDLILLDILMPEMSGYEVCQQLKTNPLTTAAPIIFLSALNDPFDKVKAFNVGAADYIAKPFQFEEVIARVRHQLALRSAQRELETLNSELEERVKERTQQLELANAQLLELAFQDRLTGLPNRTLFVQQLEKKLFKAQASEDYGFAVMFIDCDRFRTINDALGHDAGDQLLKNVAQQIKALISKLNILSRFGEDKFALLLTEPANQPAVLQLADDILKSFTQPFIIRERDVFLSISIGIVFANVRHTQPEHLLRELNKALRQAKLSGRGCYQLFEPSSRSESLQALDLERDLRTAVEQQAIAVSYQPIVNLQSGQIAGLEALACWQHPTQGAIQPGVFISLAEETGLISEVDFLVMKQAAQQLQTWQTEGLVATDLSISLNISPKHLAQNTLLRQVDYILEETGLRPQNLRLEITESSIVFDTEFSISVLQALQERGLKLSLDDFGRSYSSLSALQKLPVNFLKIDPSFVQNLESQPLNDSIAALIVNIARIMQMEVIAEGIETLGQLTLVKELGCELGQGYFFSRPQDAQATLALLRKKARFF